MCLSHYSTWYRRTHGRKKFTKTCTFCDHTYETTHQHSSYCTGGCARRHKHGWSRSKELTLVPREPRPTTPPVTLVRPARKRWFACNCRVCGAPFVAVAPYTHCSDQCRKVTRRAGSLARRVREGKFSVPDTMRIAIYERDGWECQLCGTETSRKYDWSDPLSPTLDHIIPQSAQLLPDHSPRNLRLAHALCNSLRGDRQGINKDELKARLALAGKAGSQPAGNGQRTYGAVNP